MNKKALYENIMLAVAKEVKKALNEQNSNEVVYDNENEFKLLCKKAIHYDELPEYLKYSEQSKYKHVDGKMHIATYNYMYFNKMSKSELINFITNIDWDLLKDYIVSEFMIDFCDFSEDGGEMTFLIPYVNNYGARIIVDFDAKWGYNMYKPATYEHPSYGGDYWVEEIEVNNVYFANDEKSKPINLSELTDYAYNTFSDYIVNVLEKEGWSDDYWYEKMGKRDPRDWDD